MIVDPVIVYVLVGSTGPGDHTLLQSLPDSFLRCRIIFEEVQNIFLCHALRNQTLILHISSLGLITDIILIKILRAVVCNYLYPFIEYAFVVLIGNAELFDRSYTPRKNGGRIIIAAQRVKNSALVFLRRIEAFTCLRRIMSVFRFRRKCKPGEVPLGQINPLTKLLKSADPILLKKTRSKFIPLRIALGKNAAL